MFTSAVELFVFSALVGALKKRKTDPEKDNTKLFRIMANQFYNHIGDLKLAFKFVILTSEIDNQDPVERLNRTFRNPETDENYSLFERYMLGGLDELYENLILNTNLRYEDYLTRISELIQNLKNDDLSDTENEINTDDFDF